MSLPTDLAHAGFRLIIRNERYLLISSGNGVVVGATLDEAIRLAREMVRFIAWAKNQKARETTVTQRKGQ